jgi:sugar lactone lactonase YvrE
MIKNIMKIFITSLLFVAFTTSLNAQQVQTIAGNIGSKSGVDALSVKLGTLKSSAIDAAGNIYYSDDYWIMKKDAVTGIVSKFAGTGVSESNIGKNITGSCATCVGIFTTAYLSIDQKNNLLYITSNDVNLLKLDLNTNLIYSAAGGTVQYGNDYGDGGLATSATIPGAQKVQTDSSGNIYFMQNFLDNRVRKINKASGIITTILGGNSSTPSLDGSLGINATISNGVFSVDRAGNVFYFDNNKIRKLDNQTGILSTIAGKSNPGNRGDGGLAIDADIAYPSYLHVDNQNNIYMYGDFAIRKINGSDSKINTIAGVASNSIEATGDGGLATLAKFNSPLSINTDNSNNIYIVDGADFSIRKIDASTNIITRVIGAPTFSGDGGLAKNATLNEPGAIAMDKSGNIYIADVPNHRIRKHNKSTGVITTIVGNGSTYTGIVYSTSSSTYYNGKNATDVSINSPVAIAIDSSENLFIADDGLKVIFKVSLSTGKINLIGGNTPNPSSTNSPIGDGGDVSNATFNKFTGLAIDNNNDIYFTDYLDNIIRKINTKTNIITTVAGAYSVPSQNGFSGDGGLATKAKVFYPKGLCFDANNNLYFSDYQNQVLRKVDYTTGIITTIAGMPNIFGFEGDGGSSKEAMIINPMGGLAIDKKNNILYFSDNDNSRIRRINLKNSIISTLVGTGKAGYNGDTLSPLDTKLSIKIGSTYLNGIVVDSIGDVYFSDIHNNLIRKIIEPMKVALPPSADTILPHKITIHKDKFVSLEMSQAEYDEWVKEDFFTYGPKSIKILKEIYSRFKDNFDFLICNLNEPITGQTKITYSGVNAQVSNKVKNIGRDIMDLADSYGASNGRLKANVQLAGNFITNSPLLHELVHTFANFTIDSVGFFGSGLTEQMLRAHWGFTGGNTKGQLGGFIQNTLKENVGGISNKYSVSSFGQIANGGNVVPFNEFELYTMGIIPVDSVKTFDAFKGIQSLTDSNGISTFTATSRTTFNKAKIESTLGVRVPSAADAQKDFNALFIVLTPKALTNTQIDQYDDQIVKMTKRGDDSTSFYNFWEATKGLGTLNASGLSSVLATGTIEKLDTNICSGSNIRFKAYPLMNGGIRPKYQWYKNGVSIDGENLNLFSSNNLSNNDIVKCKISNSVDSVMAEHKLVFTALVAPIVKDTLFCQNSSSSTLTATSLTGNSLKWYGTNATGGTGSAVAIVGSTIDTTTKSYYVSQINNTSGCESPRAKITVKINPAPANPIVRDTVYCLNVNVDTLKATSLTGLSLSWYGTNATGGTASALGNKPSTSVVGSFSYYVSQKNNTTGCESPRAIIGVVINPLPVAPTVKDTAYCNTINADTLRVNPIAGTKLLWYGTNATGGTGSSAAIKPSTATVGTVNYYLSQMITATGCEGPRSKIVVIINPMPSKPIIAWNGTQFTATSSSTGVNYQWLLSNISISAATSATYKPTAIGSYKIQITDAIGCKNVSDSFMLVVTAVNPSIETTADHIAKISPNPASTDVMVYFQQRPNKTLTIKLLNLNGQVLKQTNTNSKTTHISLSEIISGNYIIEIIGKDYNQTQQLLIIK